MVEESETPVWHINSVPSQVQMEVNTCFRQASVRNSSWAKARGLQMIQPLSPLHFPEGLSVHLQRVRY